MVSMGPGVTKEEMARQLKGNAEAVWGKERAEAIGQALEDTAANLWLLCQNLPDREEWPGFYFKD